MYSFNYINNKLNVISGYETVSGTIKNWYFQETHYASFSAMKFLTVTTTRSPTLDYEVEQVVEVIRGERRHALTR